MLQKLFSHPKRIFAVLALLAVMGIYAGLTLPISMYPATSKPTVQMWIPYANLSSESFKQKYGSFIESRVKKISNEETKIDTIDAYYEESGAYFEITFDWGVKFDSALKEVELVRASVSGMLPKEIADGMGVWQRNRNSGFFAGSLYSDRMPLKELYEAVNPIIAPELDKILDAEQAVVWNPESYVVNVRLMPEKLAQYGLYPRHVQNLVQNAMNSFSGSKVKLGSGNQQFVIEAELNEVSDLSQLSLNTDNKRIYLKDIAEIQYGKDINRERSFKTDGLNSLIIFAKPKSGANVKKMSEDIMNVLKNKSSSFPEGTHFRKIVDPADAINKSVQNLMKDVFLAALMAVLVLFLFIGGIKNIGTAALEIPLSMILSFIIMKQVGMNINLISLGGLALAAGMNVDASIVIMENIFRHRKIWAASGKPCSSFSQRLQLVSEAVSEVAFPVILSIATTLIVFIPMALTSDLTNAILGDLAKAVIFSHAISAVVALVVVPVVRIMVLKYYNDSTSAVMDKPLERVKSLYEKILLKLLSVKNIKPITIITPFLLAGILIATLVPKLPKEVIGKPGSDWVYMYVSAQNSTSGRHMENILQEQESKAVELLGDMVDYTWVERHNRNGGQLMFKLIDRSDMDEAKKILKDNFENSMDTYFNIDDWNPAELPLPPEYHFKAVVKGTSSKEIQNTASKLGTFLKEKDYYERVRYEPGSNSDYFYTFIPYKGAMDSLALSGVQFNIADFADISRLSNEAIELGEVNLNDKSTPVKMSLKDERFSDPANLESYPIRVKNKVIPIKALGRFESVKKPGRILIKNQNEVIEILGTLKDDEKRGWEDKLAMVEAEVTKNLKNIITGTGQTVEFQWPQEELKNALDQLKSSLLMSLGLIFFILWLQFQSVKQVGIIMMTVPLGIIGVVVSLYVFKSYLSLNSALGIILLNGITVNNSILLTDVVNDLKAKGLEGTDLIISAVNKRLRPIVITSLTTMLGMFPMALGLGDGGKILQPLGIAVTCGLFFATAMTLFVVPILLYQKEVRMEDEVEDTQSSPIEYGSQDDAALILN